MKAIEYNQRRIPRSEELTMLRRTLENVHFFRDLAPAAIDDLCQRTQPIRFGSRRRIITQGSFAQAMYIITSGRVEVTSQLDEQRKLTLAMLSSGDVFGECSVFGNALSASSCVSVVPTTLLALDRRNLLQHLSMFPQSSLAFLGSMAGRANHADNKLTRIALGDVRERLTWQLVSLASQQGSDVESGTKVNRRPTQLELANMIGASRETVSRAFNQLIRDGLIESRGRSMIVSRQLMRTYGAS